MIRQASRAATSSHTWHSSCLKHHSVVLHPRSRGKRPTASSLTPSRWKRSHTSELRRLCHLVLRLPKKAKFVVQKSSPRNHGTHLTTGTKTTRHSCAPGHNTLTGQSIQRGSLPNGGDDTVSAKHQTPGWPSSTVLIAAKGWAVGTPVTLSMARQPATGLRRSSRDRMASSCLRTSRHKLKDRRSVPWQARCRVSPFRL